MNKEIQFPFVAFGEAVECSPDAEREAAKTVAGSPITPLHTALPGRARVHVAALKGSREHEHLLDHGLAVTPGVASAKASHLTGNVLVHFDPAATSLQAIIGHIAALLSGDIKL